MTVSYDEALSALRNHVEDIAIWSAIWEHRAEPDAHARRCASDAVGAVDAAIRNLNIIRQELISQIRAADEATARRPMSCCAVAVTRQPAKTTA